MNNNDCSIKKLYFKTHDSSVPKDGTYIWKPDEYSDDSSEKEIIIIQNGKCKNKHGKQRIIFGGQWVKLK